MSQIVKYKMKGGLKQAMTQLMLVASLDLVRAQPDESNNVFEVYGICKDKPCEDPASECCDFDDGQGLKGKFCVSEQQKNGNWFGTYVDYEQTEWAWTCAYVPEDQE